MVYAEFENGVYAGYSTIPYSTDDPNIEIREITEEQAIELETQRAKLLHLRMLREDECFSIINRGEPWYDRLTEEQKAELDAWYSAWLDVTETKVIPEKPSWLK